MSVFASMAMSKQEWQAASSRTSSLTAIGCSSRVAFYGGDGSDYGVRGVMVIASLCSCWLISREVLGQGLVVLI